MFSIRLREAKENRREIAATYFPKEEPQATISIDPAPAANGFQTDVKEDEVAPIADSIESENLPERSAPFNPTVPSAAKSEESAMRLNPEAPAWRMMRVKEPTPGPAKLCTSGHPSYSTKRRYSAPTSSATRSYIMALTLPQPEAPVFWVLRICSGIRKPCNCGAKHLKL